MSKQHYQVFNRIGPVPASELVGSKTCFFPTSDPQDPGIPEGEWYCANSDCVVRQCTIRCKLFGEDMPPMRCPACSAPLQFHHWIGYEMLVPVHHQPTTAIVSFSKN
jgi:hypothetical protein